MKRRSFIPLFVLVLAIGLTYVASCATSSSSTPAVLSTGADMSTSPPSPDPRVGLKAGRFDAGEASWNMRLVSNTPAPAPFSASTNSDLAFTGPYVIQGNYNGFMVWDVSNPKQPTLKKPYVCPASQSDVSVYRNLLFVSGEGLGGRLDCGTQGVPDSISTERLRGIRIFDVSDIANPKYVANVQTCRGSHTHTVVTDPNDRNNVYIYVSGSSSVRSPLELPGCLDGGIDDPNSVRFRIEVIRVPLAAPQQAAIVSSPRIFNDLGPPPRRAPDPPDTTGGRRGGGGGRGGRGGAGADTAAIRLRDAYLAALAARRADTAALRVEAQAAGVLIVGGRGGGGGGRGTPTGPNQCHDITVYPAVGLAGGACVGYGLLLDIRDVANPRRITQAADSNMAMWHSATFSNDGSKVLFSDEWGGGSNPRCRATDRKEWGANALFTIENNQLHFKSYYKLPAAQTSQENCVAHNGSLIPIPGREVMVQGWYQGGISIFDWTDVSNPKEIAFFDRGPLDSTRLVNAGSWSVYWYNGYMYSSEIARGLDVFELTPSAFISQNEIDAAKTVRFEFMNAQEQPKLVWPPSFALARAYVDQLGRVPGQAPSRISSLHAELTRAEQLSGQQRRDALTRLAGQLNDNQPKVRALAAAVTELANAQR